MMTERERLQADLTAEPSRRDFLKRAVVMAGGMALLGTPVFRGIAQGAIDQRAYAAGKFALEIDGQTEFLKSFEGGFPKAEVVSVPVGPSNFMKKHISMTRYADIVVVCTPLMSRPLFDWTLATLNGNSIRKDGAIITASYDLKEQTRLQFFGATITEIALPACDASSKEAGYLGIKLTPESTKPIGGNGALLKGDFSKSQQKLWLPGNFALEIGGLDCSRVAKIDAFTIKQKVVQDQAGQMREFRKESGKLEFPNLAITMPEAHAGTFYKWFEDMVIKGNSGEDRERDGTLKFLSPNRQEVLLTVNFSHLGIFSFAPEKAETNAEAIRRVKIELYCEHITLSPTKV